MSPGPISISFLFAPPTHPHTHTHTLPSSHPNKIFLEEEEEEEEEMEEVFKKKTRKRAGKKYPKKQQQLDQFETHFSSVFGQLQLLYSEQTIAATEYQLFRGLTR